MKSLLLDRATWDLCLDAKGNIAVASNPYALAQDAASAIRLFSGELWYQTSKGVPYFASILGKIPPLPLIKAKLVAAAMTVPDVVSAVCYISSIENRTVIGQVQITDKAGKVLGLTFNQGAPQRASAQKLRVT